MIEIIYNKEKEKATGNEEYFCVPRNVRQIGEVSKENRIYLEDYVYTYLTNDWKEDEPTGSMAILLGKYNWKNGTAYIFVKSAVSVENICVTKDRCTMTDEQWGMVYEQMKQYFPGQEVVGWYLSIPDGGVEIQEGILRTHLKHFGGNDKVLFLADASEREAAFFLYHNNQMEKQKGYYLFYEKNDPMQEYMLVKKPNEPKDFAGKAQDRAVKDFRKIIEKKQKEKEEKELGISWSAVACMGVITLSLVAGAAWLTVQNREVSEENSPAAQKVTSIIEETHSVNDIENTKDIENVQIEDRVSEENEEGMVLLTPEPTLEESPNDAMEELADVPQDSTPSSVVNFYTQYTVRGGDTLSAICLRYYGDFSKVKEICKINNLLEDDVIYPGQTILLP